MSDSPECAAGYGSDPQLADDLMVQIDAQGRLLFVSESYCQLFGKRADQLIGREFAHLVHPDDLDATLAAMQHLHRPPYTCTLDHRALTRHGWRWLRWHDWAQRDPAGELISIIGLGRDLTQDREREIALREHEDRFRRLFQGAADPILMIEGGVFLDSNPAGLAWLGFDDISELTGRSPAELSPELQPDGVPSRRKAADLLALAHREGHCRFDWRHLRRDGSAFDVEIVLTQIPIGGRQVLHVSWRDIGARCSADQALRVSELRYRQLFEHLHAGLALHEIIRDAQGRPCDYRFLEINPAYERVTGLRAADLLGRSVREAVPGVEERWIERFGQVATTRQPLQVEDFSAPTGRWFNVVAYSPAPEQFAVIVEDITRRKQAEEDIESHRRQLATLLGNLPGMAYRCRNDADWTMLFVSDGCESLLGLPATALVGPEAGSFAARIHPEDRDTVARSVAQAGTNCQPFICEFCLIHADGTPRWVWEKGQEVEPGILEGFILDISERRKAEQEALQLQLQIQQTQKLESLGVLAGGIAHDFNNILMAIMGHAELSRGKISPMSPACDHLREIEGASRRAAELCRQMLAYAGKTSFALERVDLVELIDEMLHLLKTTISKKAILNLHCDRGLPTILADPSQIRQIVLNLIINASDAIGERSGVISIRVGATRCDTAYLADTELASELAPGLYLHLEISDTGCGMPPEVRSRIFEPFFTTKFAGRGLGLAAVLGIVRAHRGALKVYSEVNKGTTFKLLLPAETTTGQYRVRPSQEVAVEWQGRGRILIADDEESLRALAAEMCEALGFEVLTAGDGREAVEQFRLHGPSISLVLLDLTMPHLDGAEAFAALRRIDPSVRVVIASGYTADDVATRFAGKGLAGVLQKPFSLKALRDLLAKLLPEEQSENGSSH